MTDLQIREQDGATVIEVVETECGALWQTIGPLVSESKKAIVLDFVSVSYLNSMNIAAIISLRNKITTGGSTLALANVQENIRSVFRILRLEKLFNLDLDLNEALASLKE